jgi:trehalose 6-phosphate phosphatase
LSIRSRGTAAILVMHMAAADPILEPLRADPGRTAILSDVDGTLAPIVTDPAAAVVPAEARVVLRELARRYLLVACITGRRATEARRMVGLDELTYAGNHGLELLGPGDLEPRLDPALGGHGSAAAGFVGRLDWSRLASVGLRLEDKGPIQAIHWRGAADAATAEQRASELAELATQEGLVPHFGRMVLEVRPIAEVHKGVAARRLIDAAGAGQAFYGGDDHTDRDAFAALREMVRTGELERAVCVAVASADGPTEIQREADAVVSGTEGFLDLLRAL